MKISFKEFSMLDHAVRSGFSPDSAEHHAWVEWVGVCYSGTDRQWTSDIPPALAPVAVRALKTLDARLCRDMEEAGENEVAEAINDVLYIRAIQISFEALI